MRTSFAPFSLNAKSGDIFLKCLALQCLHVSKQPFEVYTHSYSKRIYINYVSSLLSILSSRKSSILNPLLNMYIPRIIRQSVVSIKNGASGFQLPTFNALRAILQDAKQHFLLCKRFYYLILVSNKNCVLHYRILIIIILLRLRLFPFAQLRRVKSRHSTVEQSKPS